MIGTTLAGNDAGRPFQHPARVPRELPRILTEMNRPDGRLLDPRTIRIAPAGNGAVVLHPTGMEANRY